MICNELDKLGRKIIDSLKREFPLTDKQNNIIDSILCREKLIEINSINLNAQTSVVIDETSNEKDIYDVCLSSLIKSIFKTIITPEEMIGSKTEFEFSEYITAGLVELYTLKYCKIQKISYKTDEQQLSFVRKLIDGFEKDLKDADINSIIFRASINDLINMSKNGYALYEQFEEQINLGQIDTKKEM